MSSGIYKKLKFDEEFVFKQQNNDIKLETFNLCCLFWQTFNEYDQKIKNEHFNYSNFEFIIFQLNIYLQQHNLAHYELYKVPKNEPKENNNRQNVNMLITSSFNDNSKNDFMNTTCGNFALSSTSKLSQFSGTFGNLNYFSEKSSIFSLVSMVYGDKKSANTKQQDEHIIINFGSLEYPIGKNSNNNTNNSSDKVSLNNSNSSDDVFHFDDKILVTPLKTSSSPPLPSFRIIDEDDLDDDDEEDDDEDEDDESSCKLICKKNSNSNNKNNNGNGNDDKMKDNNCNNNGNDHQVSKENCMNICINDLIKEKEKKEEICDKSDLSQRIHLFHLAKQQYLKMLECTHDIQHLNCNRLCHRHCHHYSFPNLRILYKLKELYVNHANDMLKFRKLVK